MELTQAVFNKLSKPELVQIILNTEANLGSQIAKLTTGIKDLLAHSKKLEAHVAIVRNVNSKLVGRVVATERQCWENAQYSRRDTLEVVGVGLWRVLGNCYRDIQAFHRLKDKDRTIVKFTNRKDCLRILRVKRQLKGLDPSAVDLPEGTKIFVNESLCPYYLGIWNKCKKLRDKQKGHQYYTINGLIRLRIEESGQAKIITHMVDLQNLFPDIEIDSSWLYFFGIYFYYLGSSHYETFH